MTTAERIELTMRAAHLAKDVLEITSANDATRAVLTLAVAVDEMGDLQAFVDKIVERGE